MLLVPVLAYILEWAVFGSLVTYSHCPRCGNSFRRRTEGSEEPRRGPASSGLTSPPMLKSGPRNVARAERRSDPRS